ncbi:hypothetical protein [Streptomyces xanthochromogenes]|uniref:hypothetical protein n=1 Tax=Streptomyces xanthochromogenes TaxID=67384 RepID=UPI00343D4ED3
MSRTRARLTRAAVIDPARQVLDRHRHALPARRDGTTLATGTYCVDEAVGEAWRVRVDGKTTRTTSSPSVVGPRRTSHLVDPS